MQPSERNGAAAAGNIYDLGYRRYDGPRLGRAYAVTQLYLHSLRAIFGIGRRNSSKIIPVGLAIITLIPAVIQLGIAALLDDFVEVYTAENYYGYIQWPLALFVAAVAPEVVGRDQRNHVLTLYFSRSLNRADYAMAKLAATTTALALLTLGPQLVLFIGRALASDDIPEFLGDNWTDLPKLAAAGLFLSLFMAGVSIAISSQTARRAYATGAILAYWAITTTIAAVTLDITRDSALEKYTLLISGFHVMRGVTFWVFDVTPELGESGESEGPGGDLVLAGLDLYWYAVVAAVCIALTFWVVLRRYRRIAA